MAALEEISSNHVHPVVNHNTFAFKVARECEVIVFPVFGFAEVVDEVPNLILRQHLVGPYRIGRTTYPNNLVEFYTSIQCNRYPNGLYLCFIRHSSCPSRGAIVVGGKHILFEYSKELRQVHKHTGCAGNVT